MIKLKNIFYNIKRNLTHLRRQSSLTFDYEKPIYDKDSINSKFNEEEQQKILDVLNKSSTEDLKKFSITQNRIKNLEIWKSKRGPFTNLFDVLEVDNMGLKVLEKICSNIVNEIKNDKQVGKQLKPRRQFITPSFDKDVLSGGFKSVVGLYVGPFAISWTKLGLNGNKVDSWNYCDFISVSRQKRTNPIETFDIAVEIVNNLPSGDAYVMEAMPTNNLQGQGQNQNSFMYNNYQLELISMLIALINSSSKHNPDCNKMEEKEKVLYKNCIYFLKHKLSAKLFNTLVGNERVSTISTILNILDGPQESSNVPFTPVNIQDDLKNLYRSLSPVYRELLGQSLMLTITFIDICVYNNQSSINAISRKKSNVLNS